MRTLEKFVTELDRATSLKQQEGALSNAIRQFDYDTYTFGLIPRLDAGHTEDMIVVSNSDPAWRKVYTSKRYFAADVTALHCLVSNEPFLWSQLDLKDESEFLPELRADLEKFGFFAGVTIPLYTTWSPYRFGIGLTRKDYTDYERHDQIFKENKNEIVTIVRLFFQMIKMREVVEEEFKITRDGHSIFRKLLLGYSRKEAGKALDLGESKIKYHIRNTVHALKAGTSDQALAKYALLGLANPDAHESSNS